MNQIDCPYCVGINGENFHHGVADIIERADAKGDPGWTGTEARELIEHVQPAKFVGDPNCTCCNGSGKVTGEPPAEWFTVIRITRFEPDEWGTQFEVETAEGVIIECGRSVMGRAHVLVPGKPERIDDEIAKTFVRGIEMDWEFLSKRNRIEPISGGQKVDAGIGPDDKEQN